MRILGLDFGAKTVGVAVSDDLGLTASGVEIIRRTKETHLRGTFRRIEELLEYYDAEACVLGLPLNMDGTQGDRALKTLEFREELLRRFKIPVFLCDERLTTVDAEELMAESGIPRREFKTHVDKVAAMLILTDFLRSHEEAIKNGTLLSEGM
ncbi:MAG: Holliday junction resolvase RuvX [Lachnospiraceae bacterium]|jgi:putative Holliday junction resolvase|nr:Holliday junction resolvase RuvX [Lachnospiraceae bacterium]MEE3377627.1 Holliday junction resolvase RuvX [Lachnospiraceae bacterium]MEE3437183.1 Holliday junction resolvase RuvX [Lachnospiraceae bacterium]MEE3457764.1 Holliday junction resolvase RuvX [Lachnospiraceae bacterium]